MRILITGSDIGGKTSTSAPIPVGSPVLIGERTPLPTIPSLFLLHQSPCVRLCQLPAQIFHRFIGFFEVGWCFFGFDEEPVPPRVLRELLPESPRLHHFFYQRSAHGLGNKQTEVQDRLCLVFPKSSGIDRQ